MRLALTDGDGSAGLLLKRAPGLRLALAAVATVGMASAACAHDGRVAVPRLSQHVVACPASTVLADLVARADLIVVAAPAAPVAQMRSAMQQAAHTYVDVPLARPSFLKGAGQGAELTVKLFAEENTRDASPATVIKLAGKPALWFLQTADTGPTGVYLVQSPDAVQEASEARVGAVRTELGRQRRLLAAWSPDRSASHFDEVRRLLAALPRASAGKQAQIFRQLEGLGATAAPAIVAQMDDRRPLAVPEMTLANPPGAFEAERFYGPQLVVDALDAILNQITGHGGSIVDGGSERERQAAVADWRVYVADLRCPPS